MYIDCNKERVIKEAGSLEPFGIFFASDGPMLTKKSLKYLAISLLSLIILSLIRQLLQSMILFGFVNYRFNNRPLFSSNCIYFILTSQNNHLVHHNAEENLIYFCMLYT